MCLESAQKILVAQRMHRDGTTEEITVVVEVAILHHRRIPIAMSPVRNLRDLEASKLREQCSAQLGVISQLELQIREKQAVVIATARVGEVSAEETSLRHTLTTLQRDLADKTTAGDATRQQLESQATADSDRAGRQYEELQGVRSQAVALQGRLREEVEAAQDSVSLLAANQQRIQGMQVLAAQRQSDIEELARTRARHEGEIERRRRDALAAGEALLCRLQNE